MYLCYMMVKGTYFFLPMSCICFLIFLSYYCRFCANFQFDLLSMVSPSKSMQSYSKCYSKCYSKGCSPYDACKIVPHQLKEQNGQHQHWWTSKDTQLPENIEAKPSLASSSKTKDHFISFRQIYS